MYYNLNLDFINITIHFLVSSTGAHMRKIFLLIVIAFGAWAFYANNYGETSAVDTIQQQIIEPIQNKYTHKRQTDISQEPIYTCDGRKYCSQMNSLEEAVFFMRNCPDTNLNKNFDGIPCQDEPRLHNR